MVKKVHHKNFTSYKLHMYYKLKNVHKFYIDNRYYICVGNVWEFDENNKFVRFLPMDEALPILDWWVVDTKLRTIVASKKDKKINSKISETKLIDDILEDFI